MPSYQCKKTTLILSLFFSLIYPASHSRAADTQLAEYSFELMSKNGSDSVGVFDAYDIAIAPDNSLWLTYRSNPSFVHMTEDGQIINQFGDSFAADPHNPEKLDHIAVSADGSVWKSNGVANITHYAIDGHILNKINNGTDNQQQTKYGENFALNPDGSLWGLASNGNMQHLNADGTLLSQFNLTCAIIESGFHFEGKARASDGTLWQINGEGSVEHSTAKGEVDKTITAPGDGNLSFVNLVDVKVAIDDTVWIQDKLLSNQSILRHYNAEGKFLGKIVNNEGTIDDFVIGLDGSIWLYDAQFSKLKHFSSTGTLIAQQGSPGSNVGQYGQRVNLLASKDGSLWVADQLNHRIQQLSNTGSFISQFGSDASGAAKLEDSFKIGEDPNGSLWVAEFNGGQFPSNFQKFSNEGYILDNFTNSVNWCGTSTNHHPKSKFAVALDKTIWVVDPDNGRVLHFNTNGYLLSTYGSPGKSVGQFESPEGIAVSPNGDIWIADNRNHRIQKFTVATKRFEAYGVEGVKNGEFSFPTKLAVSTNGNVWVVDQGNGRLQKFSANGQFMSQIGSLKNNDEKLRQFESFTSHINFYSASMAAAQDGGLWVGQYNCSEQQPCNGYEPNAYHFDDKANLIEVFNNPKGILAYTTNTVAKDGSSWVVASNGGVQHVKANGEIITEIGGITSAFLKTANDGSVWVRDSPPASRGATQGIERLLHYSATGDLRARIEVLRNLSVPPTIKNFDIAEDGTVWVIVKDQARHYGVNGNLIEIFGVKGRGPGMLYEPASIVIGKDNSIWIYDVGNRWIQKFVQKDAMQRAVEYDDKARMLYLHDVTVAMGLHYDVSLKLVDNTFILQAVRTTTQRYLYPANYDPSNGKLTIPIATVLGEDYEAILTDLGNYHFGITSVAPLLTQ